MSDSPKNFPDDFGAAINYKALAGDFDWDADDAYEVTGAWGRSRRRAMIDGLQRFVDHLADLSPSVAGDFAPYSKSLYSAFTFIHWIYPYDDVVDEESGKTAQVFNPALLDEERRRYGLSLKFADGETVGFYKDFGPIRLAIAFSRSAVCRRVEVGTEEIEDEEIVTPAVTRKVTKVVPKFETQCDPVWTA